MGFEVEFLVAVRTDPSVRQRDRKSLRALKEENKFRDYFCVYLISVILLKSDGVEMLLFKERLNRPSYGNQEKCVDIRIPNSTR
ncbi:MAG: hypothetical protein F4039_01570 [Gammaproteobacteria bacterium]|nr:hypothetical protein [Gammaproteobacteria bacterium]MYF53829.1 hypothetical protein [Gammaproteobacteria bacterium]MYK42764.1 hypothetical protein [Gammaproteobacteria bacterium]